MHLRVEVQCIMGVIRNKNALRGRNAEVFSVKVGGVCSNNFAFKIRFNDMTKLCYCWQFLWLVLRCYRQYLVSL